MIDQTRLRPRGGKHRPAAPRQPLSGEEPVELWKNLWTWKRRLLFSHFSDTAMLLGLELALGVGLLYCSRHVYVDQQLVQWVELITKWFCLSTLMLFAIECTLLLTISSVAEIRKSSQAGGF